MRTGIKRWLIGRPLKNEAISEQKMSVAWGLPILSSDAISSVAYAGEAMLIVLVSEIGVRSYGLMTGLSLAIIGLLALLVLSYRQTIDNYPNGGGAYIVAKDNLGTFAGVTAGAALSVDYVLTVAVSVSSGVLQLVSIFPDLHPYTVVICLIIVLIIMIGNLRGIRESSKIFSIPAYAFVIALLSLIVVGVYRYMNGYRSPEPANLPIAPSMSSIAMLLLALKAFSSGCTALTGVEAVSNAIPNFKHPATKNAKTVLVLLAMVVFALFGGTSILANLYHVLPPDVSIGGVIQHQSVIVEIAGSVFGTGSIMYYCVAITAFIILVLAANTSFSGFPMLVSIMAKEGFMPRQLSMRGDRLSYSNGIIALSVVAALLIVVFQGNVSKLLGLYAIGVFISFTLSQSGMLAKWFHHKGSNWISKALINGLGAFVTALVVIIIAINKFSEGAYVVVVLIPIMIFLMLKVKKHYVTVSEQLRLTSEELKATDITKAAYKNLVIVPIESINKSSIRALRYARTISENVTAFNVSIDDESGKKLRERYDLLTTDIPLIIKYSPYRKVVEPLLKFIESAEYEYQKGDIITIVLAQFSLKKWWQFFLHNHTRIYLERQLLKHKHIVVSIMPLQLKG